jgi:cyclic pyranopterin phosphate synthase
MDPCGDKNGPMMSVKQENKGHLSHIDKKGDARMVDVGDKKIVHRTARARGLIRMAAPTIQAIREDQVKKGNVLAVSRIAGIQAAKGTPDLIPLCHNLPLDAVHIDFEFSDEGIIASCEVSCQARTGVEMEALTGVSVALLTVYDMCKALDRQMVMDQIRLVHKIKEDLPV